MTDFGELDEFLAGNVRFDVAGKEYEVPALDWPTYLEFMSMRQHAHAVAEGRAKAEDGPEDLPVFQLAPKVLGPVLGELVADGVKPAAITHITQCVYFHHIGENDLAKALWSTEPEGKEQTPASGSTSTTRTGSTNSRSAKSTQRRGSQRATTSPKRSSKPSPNTKDAAATV